MKTMTGKKSGLLSILLLIFALNAIDAFGAWITTTVDSVIYHTLLDRFLN
jgi:hypothetical protein